MNRGLLWGIFAAAVAAFLWLAAPALTPFALAAIAAYIGAPLARRLEAHRAPPGLAAAIVVFIFIAALILTPLALVPLLAAQAAQIAAALPEVAERARAFAGEYFSFSSSFSSADIVLREIDWREIALSGGGDAASAASALLGWFGRGAFALVGFVVTLLIAPLAAFYLLRDRAKLAAAIGELLPPRFAVDIREISGECDRVLGEFLRGQLAVMFICALMYGILLKIAGLEFALAVGFIAGALAFIPYAGFALAFVVATIAAAGQFGEWGGIAGVWAAMLFGTAVESFFLTPKIIGERVGLHPVLALLALVAMGEILGFFGVLLALPLAAVVLTLARAARRRYLS